MEFTRNTSIIPRSTITCTGTEPALSKQPPIHEEIIKALEESIAYWNRIYLGEVGSRGGDSCPLCQLNFGLPKRPCDYCPIQHKTGRTNCLGTPYQDYVSHHRDFHRGEFTQGSLVGLKIACGTCAEIVKSEIGFLASVLEEEKAKPPKKRYFLQIGNPDVAIGENDITLYVVDEKGNRVRCGNLLNITTEGKISRHPSVNADLGLSLDVDERVMVGK